MTTHHRRAFKLGALGVASALALGGAAQTALADDTQTLVGGSAEFTAYATALLKSDPSVQGVLYDANGKITVQRLAGSTPVATTLSAKYSNITDVTVSEPAEALSSDDVVGGAGIALLDGPQGGSGGLCSVGFAAWTPDGDPAILTAGHCTFDGAAPYAFLTLPSGDTAGGGAEDTSDVELTAVLGEVAFSQLGGTPDDDGNPTVGSEGDATDIAAIDVTNEDLKLHPEVTDWTNIDDLSASILTNVTAVGDPDFGSAQVATRSGRTTGVTEGELLEQGILRVSQDENDTEGRLVTGFAVAAHADHGDSGGSIVQGSTAIGVLSAGGYDENGDEFIWGTSLTDALTYTDGYTVQLDLEEPELSDSGTVTAGAKLDGTAGADDTVEYTYAAKGEDADWETKAEV
ncbi:MAG: S1 family peptidase, partial [Microbacterium sp.]